MCDNWWPVSCHSMVLILFNAIHYRRSFPPEVPPGRLMDVCVFAAGERWYAPSSTWSATTLSNTWLGLTWPTEASTGSSTSAGTPCPRERWIAGKETGRCLSGGWFGWDRGCVRLGFLKCIPSEQVTLISEWSQIKKEFAVRDITEPFVKYHINLTNVFSPPTV